MIGSSLEEEIIWRLKEVQAHFYKVEELCHVANNDYAWGRLESISLAVDRFYKDMLSWDLKVEK